MPGARDDLTGAQTDWWFIYKLPRGVGPDDSPTRGGEYLYYQGGAGEPLRLSDHELGGGPDGALFHTMRELDSRSDGLGWIHYNDEYPPALAATDWPAGVPPRYQRAQGSESAQGRPRNHDHNGHCKGTLAFDLKSDSALWLSHSTPRIPALHPAGADPYFYPDFAREYAQTFICISLADVATANEIAAVLGQQHEPQVFGCQLPVQVTRDSDHAALWQLAQGSLPPGYGERYAEKHPQREPADLTFASRAGKRFRLLAKSGAWFDDFWIDLVTAQLGADLRIESWRRLTATALLPTKDGLRSADDYGKQDFVTTYKGREYHHEFVARDGKEIIDEVTNVDLQMLTDRRDQKLVGYNWPYTKDHAKWAISEERADRGQADIEAEAPRGDAWVCVADLNRMSTQAKRGGGSVCFHEPLLWQGLNEIERISGRIT